MPRDGRPRLVVATMHGKEQVLAPLLAQALEVEVRVAEGLDTDAFGTFSGEVPRAGSPLEAARAKAHAAFALYPEARYVAASEGSYGPHPVIPYVAGGHELVLLVDRETGHEVVGQHLTARTNYRQALVADWPQAQAFAHAVRFPQHAVIVSRCPGGDLAAAQPIAKGVQTWGELEQRVREALSAGTPVGLSADMRAHLNPTRMTAVAAAGRDLVEALRARCPACDRPGFVVAERIKGLPCGDCGAPTRQVMQTLRRCTACGETARRTLSDPGDPTWCDHCNP